MRFPIAKGKPVLARRFLIAALLLGAFAGAAGYALRHKMPTSLVEKSGLLDNIVEIRALHLPRLAHELAEQGLSIGTPVYVRIFKEENQLELWVASNAGYEMFRSYPICNFSGALGPKLQEGDHQSPEGFYEVRASALNPRSAFHLSFDLGFPNAYDHAQGRTGSHLMVHGNCVSVGCYAMTDSGIEEIYLLIEASLNAGHPYVPVHAFPFRPTQERLDEESENQWFDFWSDLAPAYHEFQQSRLPPRISLQDGRYLVEPH